MGADLAHEPVIKRDVVDAEQVPAEVFAGLGEVVEVGALVVAATVAVAVGVEGAVLEFVDGARDVEFAVGSEHGAALGELRRDDAVEHVHAAVDGLEDVDGRADAHEVAREIFGEVFGDEAGELVALGVGFTDGETADGEAVEG